MSTKIAVIYDKPQESAMFEAGYPTNSAGRRCRSEVAGPSRSDRRRSVSTPQNPKLEQKLKEVRELFADAPEIGRVALENAIQNMTTEAHFAPAGSAGRVGRRQGLVSELTVIAPFTEGGAKRLRGVLELLNGNFEGAEKVGTVHDMRFVFLDNDNKIAVRHRLRR